MKIGVVFFIAVRNTSTATLNSKGVCFKSSWLRCNRYASHGRRCPESGKIQMRKLIALLVFVSSPSFAGDSYDYQIEATGFKEWVINATVQVEGARQRIDFSSVTAPRSEYRSDAYAISTDAGATATFVYAKEKMLLEKHPGPAGTKQPNMADNGFEILVSDPKVSVKDLGDGGSIEGVATHKTEIQVSFASTVNVAGYKTTVRRDYTSMVWTTDKIAKAAKSFIMQRSFHDLMPPGIDDLVDTKFARHDDFVIKRVTTIRTPLKGTIVITTITESAKNHQTKVVADAQFIIPSDYQKVTRAPAQTP